MELFLWKLDGQRKILRTENQKPVQKLNYSKQQYHKIQINMEEGGKAIVGKKKKIDQTVQELFGWLQYIFTSHGVTSFLGGIAFGILMLVDLIFFLYVICRSRCTYARKIRKFC